MESNLKSANDVLTSQEVTKYLPYNCKWWSKYIYHFSHVINVAAILNDEMLYSRNNIGKSSFSQMNKRINENASLQVIEGTEERFKEYVRFYFRPLTPTQYHNEGIRSKKEITDLNAHCPIPVFMFFDNAIIDEEFTEFSYESLASQKHINIYDNISKLEKAPFEFIYHNTATFDQQIRKHRQAEILIKNECNLKYLKKIICRSNAERETLLSLLKPEIKKKFRHLILTVNNLKCDATNINQIFYNKYLWLNDVDLTKDMLSIRVNKRDSDGNHRHLEIICYSEKSKVICKHINEAVNFYDYGNRIRFDMSNKLAKYGKVKLKIKLDGVMVYRNWFEI